VQPTLALDGLDHVHGGLGVADRAIQVARDLVATEDVQLDALQAPKAGFFLDPGWLVNRYDPWNPRAILWSSLTALATGGVFS
jgi:hypothetical protein